MFHCNMRPLTLMVGGLTIISCTDETTAPNTGSARGPSLAAATNNWTVRAEYPRNIWDAASASITDASTGRTMVYLIGGKQKQFDGNGTIMNAVRAFDVGANVWRARAPYPDWVMATNGAVEINGRIYVSGGFARRYNAEHDVYGIEPLRSVYMYNPATNAWTRRRDMPITSVKGVSAGYKGLLYVATSCFGEAACGADNRQGALWRYNPATNNWVLLSRTPHDPGYGGGGFIGGKFYLVNDLGRVDIYDVGSNSWSTGPQRPKRHCTPTSTTLQAKLYLVGCQDDFDGSGNWPMLVFSPATGWSEAAAPPIAATGHQWTLSRIMKNGQPGLELVGGPRPQNNWQYLP